MIGAIADDVTGGTDVAVAFKRQGLRTAIYFGTPDEDPADIAADAVVIALKTRTTPSQDAVRESLAAAAWLSRAGATQLYFKYCSTFDSTRYGNIGPVLDALRDSTGADVVVTTPASPEHGRTQYNGYLFVQDLLLSESHMRNHPLTPMHDSLLPRLMDAQSRHQGSTVITHGTVAQGPDRILETVAGLSGTAAYAFADAVSEEDLVNIARAVTDAPLVAGAAGLAGALAAVRAEKKSADAQDAPGEEAAPGGRAIVLAGSCSKRSLEQIDAMITAGRPAYRLDALKDQNPESLAAAALEWYDQTSPEDAPLIYSSVAPEVLHNIQAALGTERSAEILEGAIGLVAAGLAYRGVTRFVAAGGETSGSVVAALGINGGTIGPEAARGVPWIHTKAGHDVLLKSGNFGGKELLIEASATGVPA